MHCQTHISQPFMHKSVSVMRISMSNSVYGSRINLESAAPLRVENNVGSIIQFYQKCTETICETISNLFICLNVLQFCAKVGKYSCRNINTSSRLDKLICFDRGWTCYILIMDAKGAPLTRNLCFGLHLQLHIQALFVVSDNKSGSKLHSELKQICTCG